ARSLVDDDRDVDALAVGREHHARRADLHAQIALVVVEGTEHQDVALEDVLRVRSARPEREEAAAAGLDLVAKLGVRHVVVADERDAAHGDRLVLDDLELDDDLVLARAHHVVADVGEEEALLAVGVLDLLHAPAHGGHAQDRVRLDLDGLVELVVLDLVVALERDLFDVRALAHDEPEHDAAVVGGQIDLDVFEEARVPDGVHVAREVRDLEELRRLLAQIGEDVVARYAGVADDVDGDDREPFGLIGDGGRQDDRRLSRSGGRGRGGGPRGGRRGGGGVSTGTARRGRRGGRCGRRGAGVPRARGRGSACIGARRPRRSPIEEREEHSSEDGKQANVSHRGHARLRSRIRRRPGGVADVPAVSAQNRGRAWRPRWFQVSRADAAPALHQTTAASAKTSGQANMASVMLPLFGPSCRPRSATRPMRGGDQRSPRAWIAKMLSAITLARRAGGELRMMATLIGQLMRKSAISAGNVATKKVEAVAEAMATAARGAPRVAPSAGIARLPRAIASSISRGPRAAPLAVSARSRRAFVARSAKKPPTSVPTIPAATVTRPKTTLARPGAVP